MSEQLGTAVIAQTLKDALDGDPEAWKYLTHPSETLQLWCQHLDLDMDAFNEMMDRLSQENDPQHLRRVVDVWRRRTVIVRQGMTGAERQRKHRKQQELRN